MNRKIKFPNDKKVTVIRKNLTEYKAWESEILIRIHKWNASEVRVYQAVRDTLD